MVEEKKPVTRSPFDSGMIFGIILVGFGGLLLLQTLGMFRLHGDLWVSLAFFAGAIAFLMRFVTDQRQWWALIPGLALASIGALIGVDELFPAFRYEGSIFLGGIGLAFLLIYLVRRTEVWPIIPAGALLTLATVAFVEQLPGRFDGAFVFFWGLALTFAAVYLLADNRPRYSWALIVAAVLFGIGWLVVGGATFFKVIFPLALIAVGAFMLLRPDRR